MKSYETEGDQNKQKACNEYRHELTLNCFWLIALNAYRSFDCFLSQPRSSNICSHFPDVVMDHRTVDDRCIIYMTFSQTWLMTLGLSKVSELLAGEIKNKKKTLVVVPAHIIQPKITFSEFF
jgi:hypothetical protein